MAEALDPAVPPRVDELAQFVLREACARAMAEGAIAASNADIACAITGFTEGGPGQPAGLVHIACGRKNRPGAHRELRFGDVGRAEVRIRAQEAALGMMRDQLIKPAA